jgi:hypothetical protein
VLHPPTGRGEQERLGIDAVHLGIRRRFPHE